MFEYHAVLGTHLSEELLQYLLVLEDIGYYIWGVIVDERVDVWEDLVIDEPSNGCVFQIV